MSLIDRIRKGFCVYWAPVGTDQFGKPLLGAPIELTCRWEDVIEEVLSAEGEKTLTKAKVFVGQDVVPRGVLVKGQLNTITDQLDPFNNVDWNGTPAAHRIIAFNSTPDIKYRKIVRIAYLI